MSAGELRERVAFEQRAVVDDGYGNDTAGEFAEAFRVAARIKPARGGETIQAERLAGRQPVVITVRCSNATRRVTTDWRVRDVRKDVVYNIRSIANPDERGAYFDMECEAGVST